MPLLPDQFDSIFDPVPFPLSEPCYSSNGNGLRRDALDQLFTFKRTPYEDNGCLPKMWSTHERSGRLVYTRFWRVLLPARCRLLSFLGLHAPIRDLNPSDPDFQNQQ